MRNLYPRVRKTFSVVNILTPLSVKMDGFQWTKNSLEKQQKKNASLWTVGHMQTKQWTETNVSSDYIGVLILEKIIPRGAFIFSINSVISFSQIIWLRWYNWWICFITKKVKWKNSSVRHLLLLYFIPFPSHSEWWLVRLVSVEWLCGRHLRGKPAHSNKNLHVSHTKWRGSLVHRRKCAAVRLFEWVFTATLLFFWVRNINRKIN